MELNKYNKEVSVSQLQAHTIVSNIKRFVQYERSAIVWFILHSVVVKCVNRSMCNGSKCQVKFKVNILVHKVTIQEQNYVLYHTVRHHFRYHATCVNASKIYIIT